MTRSVRRFAVSLLSGGLLALGSSIAIAQTVNNIDNTTPGMAGHGTGCSNFAGGCRTSEVSTAHGAYQPSNNLDIGATPASPAVNPMVNSSNTAPAEKQPYVGCLPASEATPGHCMTGGLNN